MATEIYLQPELEELVIDADKKAEWQEKVTRLGLEGQMKLTSNSALKSASPYTFMNKQMKLVFETLCPTKCEVAKYSKSVIPIDVLSHVALCKQEGYFKKVEVWYDDTHPDPVLVGHLSTGYNPDMHIIARWGDEILPFEILVDKAVARYTAAYKLALSSVQSEASQLISEAALKVQQLFTGVKNTYDLQPKFQMPSPSFDSSSF